MFRTERISEALWPEVLGVGTYLGASLIGASIDVAMREKGTYDFPVAQTVVTYGSLGGGAAALGFNKAPDFSKGLMIGSGVGLMARAIEALWGAVRKDPARIKASDVAALIPRRVGAAKPKGAGNTGFSLDPRKKLRFNADVSPAKTYINDLPRETIPQVVSRRGM